MNCNFVIRQVTPDDIHEILCQRQAMYRDMDYPDSPELAAMLSTCEPYLQESLGNGSFHGWFALSDGAIAGGGAVVVNPWPSHPYDLECRRATILNVYVYPQFRRQGVARELMRTMIDWCKSEKFAMVYLHASRDGRHLYESLGFEPTSEMKLKLR
jgi:GNAT superfamily N-acetyltransferase